MYILLILAIALLWYLQDRIFSKKWDQNISVELRFADQHIYEGEKSFLKEIVVNDKKFPIPALGVRISVDRNIKFVSDAKKNSMISDQTYKRDIFSFAGRQQITRKLKFVAEKRGFYELKQVDVSAYNFFFESCGSITFQQNTSMFVFPAPVSTDKINLICHDINGMIISQNKLNPDPFEFYGIREYVNTDPMNHINWKASVRTGELMVNQFDSTTNINIQIILDLEDSGIIKKELLIEESIRIASSLATRLALKNMTLTVLSNGIDYENDEAIKLYMPAGGGKVLELNQKLACVNVENIQMSTLELLGYISASLNENNTYIFISKNYSKDIENRVSQLVGGNSRVLWIMPQNVNDEAIDVNIPRVNIMRWEVG